MISQHCLLNWQSKQKRSIRIIKKWFLFLPEKPLKVLKYFAMDKELLHWKSPKAGLPHLVIMPTPNSSDITWGNAFWTAAVRIVRSDPSCGIVKYVIRIVCGERMSSTMISSIYEISYMLWRPQIKEGLIDNDSVQYMCAIFSSTMTLQYQTSTKFP